MAPFYRGFQSRVSLESDDLVAVQALYGPRGQGNLSQQVLAEERGETQRADNRLLCLSPTIDTILSTQDGDSFVLKGENLWKLTDDSVAPGYPKKIVDVWPGLPGENLAVPCQSQMLKYFHFSSAGRRLHIFEWKILFLQS